MILYKMIYANLYIHGSINSYIETVSDKGIISKKWLACK